MTVSKTLRINPMTRILTKTALVSTFTGLGLAFASPAAAADIAPQVSHTPQSVGPHLPDFAVLTKELRRWQYPSGRQQLLQSNLFDLG